MRVVVLADRIPPNHQGGAEVVAWRMAQGLYVAGVDVHVITTGEGKPSTETRNGIPVHTLHSHYPERWRAYVSLYNPQTIPALATLYDRLKPDIVHAHNIHTHLSYASLGMAKRRGIPTVLTAHDPMPFAYGKLTHFARADCCDYAPEAYRLPAFYNLKTARLRYNPVRNLVIRRVLAGVSLRLAVSHALADALHANRLPTFEVLHNGIDANEWHIAPAQVASLQAELGLAGKKVILFGGRLTTQKGTRQLLAAMRIVRERVPEAVVLVLSARPLEDQLTPAERAEFEGVFISAGWREGSALRAAFGAARVVAVPSINLDPLPTMTLEAAAAHKPVVATCFGGSREVVQDGITGYIVNPLQPHVLAERLMTLLQDSTHAERMGNAASQRVHSTFSLTSWIEKTLAHYQALR